MKTSDFEPVLAGYFEKKTEVIAAYLFGSYAEGVARSDSDVDIAVIIEPLPARYFKIPPGGNGGYPKAGKDQNRNCNS